MRCDQSTQVGAGPLGADQGVARPGDDARRPNGWPMSRGTSSRAKRGCSSRRIHRLVRRHRAVVADLDVT
jgi:hypothetical protein